MAEQTLPQGRFSASGQTGNPDTGRFRALPAGARPDAPDATGETRLP